MIGLSAGGLRATFDNNHQQKSPMRNSIIHTFVMVVALWPAIAATQNQSGASDLELGAAYCVAFMQGSPRLPKVAIPSANEEFNKKQVETNDALDKIQAEIDGQISRLKSYLYAHDWLKNPTPFTIAIRRGQQDAQDCWSADHSACDRQCSQACKIGPNYNNNPCLACIKSCGPIPACQRGAKCDEVEKSLPF